MPEDAKRESYDEALAAWNGKAILSAEWKKSSKIDLESL
jgi:hypothetical protein